MKLPSMYEISQSRTITDAFGGYNHNIRIGDGEFFDEQNLTSDFYPVLAPRGKRGAQLTETGIETMISKDERYYIKGTKLYKDGTEVGALTLSSEKPKIMVSFGAYIIILPDKKWVNTKETLSYGNVEAYGGVSTEGATIKFTMCTLDPKTYESEVTESDTAPDAPVDGQYWINTGVTPNALMKYSAQLGNDGEWIQIPTNYIKITAANTGTVFEVNDGVNISGLNTFSSAGDDVKSIEGTYTIHAKGEGYIVIQGDLQTVQTLTVENTEHTISQYMLIKRTMPDMDFVIESGNRLWGCKYGMVNGKFVNEIYASKLGDFKNWNSFAGVSTDSYVASVGTDGAFTGAYTYLGKPLFFKEDFIHKVYGDYPANYQIQTTACRGVQAGSDKSIAMVNETLFYLGKNGVCAYDGALPSDEVSSVFGESKYTNGVAGAHLNKYYISMKNSDNKYDFFVLDVAKGIWHREDNTQVKQFCSHKNELYFIDAGDDGTVKTVFGSGTKDTKKTKWFAETGTILIEYPDAKYLSNINIRMQLDFGSTVFVYAQYDSNDNWEHLFTITSSSLRSFSMPIKPRRCDHMRLRIEGEGEAKIYSITKTLEQGSDAR